MIFQNAVISWYLTNKRDLPWRHTKDAYIIWLSEIILQQTRVDQGLPYFNKFLINFPRVSDFAAATEAEVLKLWQGLGYYSRGRNMYTTAQAIMTDFNGVFPTLHDDLIKLKGIGEYSAAAISSFASGEARAVVDGNVYRVLARYYGIETPINTTAGKKEFYELANELLYKDDPGLYNQSIMEFGALQCKPKSPDCSVCSLNLSCYAFNNNEVTKLPVKIGKPEKKHRYFNYFVCVNGDEILVRERQAGDVWQHLYDFPCIEMFDAAKPDELRLAIIAIFGDNVESTFLSSKKHILTHQIIHVQFFALKNYIFNFSKQNGIRWVSLTTLNQLPKPNVIRYFIDEYFSEKSN